MSLGMYRNSRCWFSAPLAAYLPDMAFPRPPNMFMIVFPISGMKARKARVSAIVINRETVFPKLRPSLERKLLNPRIMHSMHNNAAISFPSIDLPSIALKYLPSSRKPFPAMLAFPDDINPAMLGDRLS